jgi:large subunit ribosomal protein L24
MKIKTGDNVRVMSGKDKGKEGKVTQVLPKLGMVVVEGINATVRHMKAKGKQPGQRVNYNAPIRIEKVSLLSEKSQGKGKG